MPLAGTDLLLVLGKHLSVHWQHLRVSQLECPLAWAQLALRGCCLEPLWTLLQSAWERCWCLMVAYWSPLQQGHPELGAMWLWVTQHRHCLQQDQLCALLAQGMEAAHAEWWWELEGYWLHGQQCLERRPQLLPLPESCLVLLEPQGELPSWESPPAQSWSWLGPVLWSSTAAPGCLRGETKQPQLDQPRGGPSRQEPARRQLPAGLT